MRYEGSICGVMRVLASSRWMVHIADFVEVDRVDGLALEGRASLTFSWEGILYMQAGNPFVD